MAKAPSPDPKLINLVAAKVPLDLKFEGEFPAGGGETNKLNNKEMLKMGN